MGLQAISEESSSSSSEIESSRVNLNDLEQLVAVGPYNLNDDQSSSEKPSELEISG